MEALWQYGRDQLQGVHMLFTDDMPPDARRPEGFHQTVCMQGGKPTNVVTTLHTDDVAAFLSTEQPNDDSPIVPELRLVRLNTSVSFEHEPRPLSGNGVGRRLHFKLARAEFANIFARLDADPWALWLLSNNLDGFHHVPATDHHPDTYYYGLDSYALIWTSSASTVRTRCLLVAPNVLERHDNSIHRGNDLPFPLLTSLAPHLWTPYMLLFNTALTTMMDLWYDVDDCAGIVTLMENTTGRFPRLYGNEKALLEAKLANLSSHATRIRMSSARILHHHENAMRALSALASGGPCPTDGASHAAEYDRSMASMRSTIPVLEARAATFRSYGASVMQRAEAQANVLRAVFALLTHRDSMLNLKVAMAAKDTAAAAKRDSSAMKTIAALTMAFLPATFLAALFALPAVEWDRKMHVDADGSVLFWSVAIPLTLIVFLVWAFITQRAGIVGLILRKKAKVDMDRDEGELLTGWYEMTQEVHGSRWDAPRRPSGLSAELVSADILGRAPAIWVY